MFWRAAKTTYKQEFDKVMDKLNEIDADAHRWLDFTQQQNGPDTCLVRMA